MFIRLFTIFCSLLFVLAAVLFSVTANADGPLYREGHYRVVLKNYAKNLPCRYGPTWKHKIRMQVPNGSHIYAKRLANFDNKNPWFFINYNCFIPANSAFLQWRGATSKDNLFNYRNIKPTRKEN